MKSELKNGHGIKSGLVLTYGLGDINWTKEGTSHYDIEYCFLATKCVDVAGTIYIRDKSTAKWTAVSKDTRAKIKLFNEWGGVQRFGDIDLAITFDLVGEYFAKGLVCLSDVIFAPGCGDFVIFDNEKRLNLYCDERIIGDTDDIAYCEELLKVIRGSLCGIEPEISLDEMIKEVVEGNTVFAWIIQWLAARYQNPGFVTQTNLWLIGETRGIGKGSLLSVMRYVLGGSAVTKANKSEISRGWDDFLFGRQLIEWDEFQTDGGYFDYLNYIKMKTGNDIVQLTTRGKGLANHPNIAMHIFTTNNEQPIMVEKHDRQNTYCKTTDNQAKWGGRAKALWHPVTNELVDVRIASGFAALLNLLDIDYKFIKQPFKTDMFEGLVDTFKPTYLRWFDDTDPLRDLMVGYPNGRSNKFDITEMHTAYCNYVKAHYSRMKPVNIDDFKKQLVKAGKIENKVFKVDGVSIRKFVFLNEDGLQATL